MKKKALLLILTICFSAFILVGCTQTGQKKQTAQVNMFRSIDFPSDSNTIKIVPNIDIRIIGINHDDSEELLSEIEEGLLPGVANEELTNSQDHLGANGLDESKGNNQTNNSSETEAEISPITTARAQFIMNSNPYVSKETAIYFVQLFEQYQQMVPYMEVEALMGIARIESVYDAGAISYYAGPDGKHFLGLMQLHEDYEGIYGYGQNQLYDPACNIECACRLLKDTADRVPEYNYDQTCLICAYHQGPVSISNFDYSYSDLVYQFANQIKALYQED